MDSGDSFIDFADSVKSLGLCRVWARFFGFVFAVFRRFLPFAVGFMPCAVSVALSALCGFYFAMFGGLFVVVPAAFLPCLLAVVFSVSRLPAFGRLPWLPLVVSFGRSDRLQVFRLWFFRSCGSCVRLVAVRVSVLMPCGFSSDAVII
ncbi:MAG: hypothetical protein J5725_00550, partial [Bacteroidales bacterium]|nr:hypothetical protein [Bacteroidales bacterium]